MTPIPSELVDRQSREFHDLFDRYNAMATAVNEREQLAAELAEEEKLASVGRLASGMAHEINNPLGGMFNALDSLRRYGGREEVRATSIRLLEQGLSGIRDLVRSTLTSYRADQRPRDLTPMDLDDLRLLVKPEARQRRLRLSWQIEFSRSRFMFPRCPSGMRSSTCCSMPATPARKTDKWVSLRGRRTGISLLRCRIRVKGCLSMSRSTSSGTAQALRPWIGARALASGLSSATVMNSAPDCGW